MKQRQFQTIQERSQRASTTNGFEGRADISHVDQEELFSRASAAAPVQTYTAIQSDRKNSVVLLRLVMQDVILKLRARVKEVTKSYATLRASRTWMTRSKTAGR